MKSRMTCEQIRGKLEGVLINCKSVKQELRNVKEKLSQMNKTIKIELDPAKKCFSNNRKNIKLAGDFLYKQNDSLVLNQSTKMNCHSKQKSQILKERQLYSPCQSPSSMIMSQQSRQSQKTQCTENSWQGKKLNQKIMKELHELKILEKREEMISRTNQRMKVYYSQHKKSLENSSSLTKLGRQTLKGQSHAIADKSATLPKEIHLDPSKQKNSPPNMPVCNLESIEVNLPLS